MNKEEDKVTVPVSTIDISFDTDVESEDESKISHIHQIPFFQRFTIDEIRYYDYLKAGYISVVKPEEPRFFHQNQFQFNQYHNSFNQNQFSEPNPVYHKVSPWSINYPSISEKPFCFQPNQDQPYGVLPDFQFEQDNLPDEQ